MYTLIKVPVLQWKYSYEFIFKAMVELTAVIRRKKVIVK